MPQMASPTSRLPVKLILPIRTDLPPDFAPGPGDDLDGLRRQARVQQQHGELQRHHRGVGGGLEFLCNF